MSATAAARTIMRSALIGPVGVTVMADGFTRAQVAELSAAILARGLDLQRLSEAADLKPETLRWIMEGRLRPTDNIRRRLAGALGIDPGALL